MKRLLSVSVAALVALAGVRASALQAQAPALPTIDEVLEKFIAAIGGRAAIEKHTSRVSTGTLESPGAPINGTFEVSEKAPDKALTVLTFQNIGLVREGVDASGGWSEDPRIGLRVKTGQELADARLDGTFNSELKYKEMYPSLIVTGREPVGGVPTIVVLGTPKDGTPRKFWFDASTGLLIRSRSTRNTDQGPVDIDVFVEDYREVDGIKTPFRIRQVTPIFTMIFRISEVKFNVALDDAIFRKPGLR